MHLLAAQPGAIDDGQEPVDPGQTPAEVIFISAADTELVCLSEARSALQENAPDIRLINMMHLKHPMSVDLHLDQCATKSKLVVARILGGTGYWKYGAEQYSAMLSEYGIPFVALPGDDKPDDELWRLSTVSRSDWEALLAYFVEGGTQNICNALLYSKAIIHKTEKPEVAKPLLRAGTYWPGIGICEILDLQKNWIPNAPTAPIIFYRALLQGGGLNPINRLVKTMLRYGLNPMPIFVTSLKDPISAATLKYLFAKNKPEIILNCTSFSINTPNQLGSSQNETNPLTMSETENAMVFQLVLSSSSEEIWRTGMNGLSGRDIAMNVALPEVDGRILGRAISFKGEAFFDEATQCSLATYQANGDRIDFIGRLISAWVKLRKKNSLEKKVGIILANYPNKDGRLANGVGLDTPAATIYLMKFLSENGYSVKDSPETASRLMEQILSGPTNWLTDRNVRNGGVRLSLKKYNELFKELPFDVKQSIEDKWGKPEQDPFVGNDGFALSILEYGNITIGIQPARGYNIDPKETYHSPDLVPPHNYFAFYFWLRYQFKCDALIHMGKHGNLEWLPGKALALSENCFPEVALGPTPNIYPFIVNDPGEGTQAKRRSSAVIIDHLTPPLTRAETYGPLKELEALVDEYYEAAGIDPNRINYLRKEIISLTSTSGLDIDAGMAGDDSDADLAKLDAYLCDLKEAQIRDGLHIFGQSPEGRLERDLLQALVRIPRDKGIGEDASLIRALATDFGLNFDPLNCNMSDTWEDIKPLVLEDCSDEKWRSHGDTVERLEIFASKLIDGIINFSGKNSDLVMKQINETVRPVLRSCGSKEHLGVLNSLNGDFIQPGSSGAPTRGRLDVLPTGRNFFSVDNRAVPTPTAWALGWKSANLLLEKHLQNNGDWPKSLLITAWGTANMRTGGDDIAQAMALMGVKPKWDLANRRVTGFEILPLSILDRPRVDVTLRVSGFFRDAFPQLISLIDSAAVAVMKLDEPLDMNPAKAATDGSKHRVFGSKPGAYGAGLQAMIDERLWNNKEDLSEAYLSWGSYAYGSDVNGIEARKAFESRLSGVEAIVQNQDNREHDILDSDDYYQFEGGAAAAVKTLQGRDRPIYHNDHSRPENPVIRTLEEEIGRVVRSRVVNPKWIDGVKRHGYKGAFEMAATLDYLFAFSATTGAVANHHFDLVYQAFIENEENRQFIIDNNTPAFAEIIDRFQEAIDRELWIPKSNSAQNLLTKFRKQI